MRTLITAMAAAVLLTGAAMAQDPGRIQDRERGIIDRTQNDLRTSAELERHKGKQIDRFENAQKQLSDFDRELTKGHFDKGRLDHAIDSMKDVVDHNTLDPTERDALRSDLADLRIMREDHERR